MENKNTYYTYTLTDPRDYIPFYVGKGKGNRMYMHEIEAMRRYKGSHKPHHDRIREIRNAGLKIIYDKVLINASEYMALQKEKMLVEQIGRQNINTGPLLNISPGGTNGGTACKPVSQYDLDGNFIQTFLSAKEASERVTSANRSYITQCCKGKRRSSGGFLWSYADDATPTYFKKYHKPVLQLSIEGVLISKYPSLTAAQAETGIELHNISECCRGNSKTAGGFIWKYDI